MTKVVTISSFRLPNSKVGCGVLACQLSGLVTWIYLFLTSLVQAQITDVLTYHNDNARTGQALHEEVLTLTNVNTNHFGLLRFLKADGVVDAQPLYAAGVPIPGKGLHNLLIVATENDTVYAFDADGTNVFWKVSLVGPKEGPSFGPQNCDQVAPTIGVTATPVIDRNVGPAGTIFVVATSTDGTHFFQKLHALDLATGTDLIAPVLIGATFPGNGDGTDGTNVVFNPAQYKERPALLLLNGVVYTAWSSHCDSRPYTGWIIGYDELTLARRSVLNVTPNGSGGAIWMSGCGLASDFDGNIFLLAGNGTLDTNLTANGFPSMSDYGNAFLKLTTTNSSLNVADYFATYATPSQNAKDLDLGSGGGVVLPDMADSQGITRQLAVGAGKDANIYLVDRSNMGKFNPTNDDAIYQKLVGVMTNGVFSTPAYFNQTLYYGSQNGVLQAFPFQDARLQPATSHTAHAFRYPGATPAVSADGTNNAILWAVDPGFVNSPSPAVLYAYPAGDLSSQLYLGAVFHGTGAKFVTSTIASGRVYVGITSGVGVFGLLDQSTLTPIQKWRDDNFKNPSNVGIGANAATPAGDSIPNLVKYALGLDPFAAASSSDLILGSTIESGSQAFAVLSVKRSSEPPDVTYIVEVSNDLRSWSSGAGVTQIVTDSPSILVVQDLTPIGSVPRFMRLRVSNP
jgi:hypothetical protein